MMKKIYFTLVILFLVTITMAYLYFSNLKTETNANNLSLNAASVNSSIVFSFENDKSFYEILSGQEILQQILGQSKSKQLKSLYEHIIKEPNINQLINGQKTYVSFLPGNNNDIDYLISTQLKTASQLPQILSLLQSKNIKIEKAGNINQLTLPDSSIYFLGIKGMLVTLSNKSLPIQNALSEQKTNPAFVEYIKTNSRFTKNTLANLFIDFNNISPLLKNILNTNINGELNLFNKQNSFAAFSYNFGKEKLLFNGNTDVNDENNYYALFTKISEQKIFIDKILPKSTANYTIYMVTDYKSWAENLQKWLGKLNQSEKINKNLTNINQKYRLDINQIFSKYFKNQFINFQINTGEKFGAIALSNGDKFNQLLLDLSSEYTSDIRIFKEANILYAFFGEPFKKFERPFYTIIDNYLIVSNNASSIQVFLNNYRNNELLINDENYINVTNQLSSSATIFFYINNKNSKDIFNRNLKSAYYNQYIADNGLKDYNAFCYQLSANNGKFLSNILLLKNQPKIKTDTLTNINIK